MKNSRWKLTFGWRFSDCIWGLLLERVYFYQHLVHMMVHFICQLGWATGCPDICSNIIQGVSVKVFLDEINSWISRPSKVDCLPGVGGPLPIRSRPEDNKMDDFLWRRHDFSCLTFLDLRHGFLFLLDSNWNTGSSCSQAFWHLDSNYYIISSDTQAFGFWLVLHHWLSQISSLLTYSADLGTYQPLQLGEPISCNKFL